ncbi:MAG: hydroxymethylglutaryl-CoA reductase, degradative [Spirochaetes bacterium RIFOXYC1_FULL_54_7]|nr:MAG: hydroxymethylglutaryl-CoA reductase, degradative [Spirochaetes bacterium RIFOXYC1_FULL_54_7]
MSREQAAGKLPEGFRKLAPGQRKSAWETLFLLDDDERAAAAAGPGAFELADLMVEAAVGVLPLPLGIASGFMIDGERVDIPMAVEEPSVVAATGYAAHIIAKGGGFFTEADEPVMESYVYLEGVDDEGLGRLRASVGAVQAALSSVQSSLERRGGGFRSMRVERLPETGLVSVELSIDVRDAMGANILNTAAETAKPILEAAGRGTALMCILSNASPARRARARFSLPLEVLAPYARGYTCAGAARRMTLSWALADEDPRRAVTHNKGIMNGVAALVQATMNDTRAVEAAAHAWAARTGRVRPLSRFSVSDRALEGSIDLPLALGTVGGSVDLHPASRAALRLLGNPDSRRLARIAAALGLAQNFSAVLALVCGGIQHGHMRLHAARLAYRAGARGAATREAAELMARGGIYTMDAARRAIGQLAMVRQGMITQATADQAAADQDGGPK